MRIVKTVTLEGKCPICNRTFQEWYCPSCGLPICACSKRLKNSSSEFQYCDKCNTPNPYGAKYCKNCGENITLHAKDMNWFGWIDLGLSVLWSTETIKDFYLWNHSNFSLNLTSNTGKYFDFDDFENKDVATTLCGEKWRTPTKEEFEELLKRCKWEKCIDPITKEHALKAIGPNGNSIIIPVTGYAGCNATYDLFTQKKSIVENEAIYSSCRLWTSTEDEKYNDRAYAFCFTGYKGFKPTLTAREIKERELEKSRRDPDLLDEFIKNIGKKERNLAWFEIREKRLEQYEQKRQLKKQREDEEREILRAMGDDSQEKADNIKKDQERRHRLWLDTPIEMSLDNERPSLNTIRPMSKDNGFAIRPVADKKWQGKL